MIDSGGWRRQGPKVISAVIVTAALVAVHWSEPTGRSDGGSSRRAGADGSADRSGDAPGTPGSDDGPMPIRSSAGFNALAGPDVPIGRAVVAGHVEGPQGHYLPHRALDAFRGIDFVVHSGPGRVSHHATATARRIYGSDGLAPGIETVHLFSSNHFLGRGVLNGGRPRPPNAHGVDVFNHSWVARRLDRSGEALRRTDYLIDKHDVIMVAGVDNGGQSPVPPLMASAFNAIAVGHWSGNSSGGYTWVETAGRCKPDLVAPGDQTSIATPVVSAMAARLIEAAGSLDPTGGRRSFGRRAEVIKAALMAGAVKPPQWRPAAGKPLDEHLGAGRANINRALTVLRGRSIEGDTLTGPAGWHFGQLERGKWQRVQMKLDHDVADLSVMLIWHRRVDGAAATDLRTRSPVWLPTARMANFDLTLLHLGPRQPEHGRIIARSASEFDNVEHVYLTELRRGTYRFEIRRQDRQFDPWDYVLAWFMTPVADRGKTEAALDDSERGG